MEKQLLGLEPNRALLQGKNKVSKFGNSESLRILSEKEILREIQNETLSEKDGYGELIVRHTPRIQQLVHKWYPRSESIADDITADTIITALTNIHHFDPTKGDFIAWLSGIAKNKVREAIRREGKLALQYSIDAVKGEDDDTETLPWETASTSEKSVEYQVISKDAEKTILEALLAQPEIDQIIFLLKNNYNLTNQELAEILNKAQNQEKYTDMSVAARLSRTRKRLRSLLHED